MPSQVDFIFGDGEAVFERCEIHSTEHNGGYITAQGKHYANEDSGFVLNRCKLTEAPGVTGVWLGRPWRRYASVVFLDTEMGGHISPAGWRERHPGETNYMETVFYAEFGSSGLGAHAADRDPRSKQLTTAEAARFETKRFLAGADGWNPTAGTRRLEPDGRARRHRQIAETATTGSRPPVPGRPTVCSRRFKNRFRDAAADTRVHAYLGTGI